MYKELPSHLQEKIKEYLMANQFRKAKALHDAWIIHSREQGQQRAESRV